MMEKDIIIRQEYDIIKNDFARAGEASSSIKKILRQLGIDSTKLRKTAIATYEAEMNVVIHSNGGKIIFSITKDKITIEARDKGPGIKDVDMAMKEGYSTASNKVRELGFGAGMGLPNIKRCVDDLKIQTKEGEYTNVIMEIFI